MQFFALSRQFICVSEFCVSDKLSYSHQRGSLSPLSHFFQTQTQLTSLARSPYRSYLYFRSGLILCDSISSLASLARNSDIRSLQVVAISASWVNSSSPRLQYAINKMERGRKKIRKFDFKFKVQFIFIQGKKRQLNSLLQKRKINKY